MNLIPPLTDLQLEGFINYFGGRAQDCEDIRSLCNAILDCRNGLGLVWKYTECEEIEQRFAQLPKNYYITQVGKALLKNVQMLKRAEETNNGKSTV